jgi:superfamily I DNA/RNA helicase
LTYKVFEKENEEEKYQAARDLIESKNCPTIIYVSRTRKAYTLAERLSKDGFNARPYHGKMDKQEKSENQNAFINGETIFVSTIHKAKGKEFDNVFVLLDNYNAATDEAKRQLYVAMTRAKRNLTIHLNTALFDNFSVENLEYFKDTIPYEPPKQLVMHLTFKDIWLDYFAYRQHIID